MKILNESIDENNTNPTPSSTTEDLEKKVRESRLSKKLGELLYRQLQHELENHNLYKTFSLYYSKKGLMKLSKYYNERAQEELNHSNWIFDYLIENDYIESYPAVKLDKIEIENNTTPFELTLDVEIKTTNMIYDIVNQAQEDKEWITFNWLMQDLVPEQLEEEKLSRVSLKIAKRDTDWVAKENEILNNYEG